MDIAGFFYDPTTKRYYRESDSPWANVKLKPKITETKIKPTDVPPKGILGLLRNREIEVKKNPNFDISFLKLKTNFNFGTGEDLTQVYNEVIYDICMVKGGRRSVFGLWKILDSFKDILTEVAFEPTNLDSQFKFQKVKWAGIRDFCDGFRNSELLMYISNDYAFHSSEVVLLRRPRADIEIVNPVRATFRGSSVFSCCSNSSAELFAIGSEHSIFIEDAFRTDYSISVKGNVHSVHYNDTGSVLYCGTNTGVLSILDLRQPLARSDIKLYETGINEIVVLSNQQEVITGSFDGNLSKLDLRMKMISANFFNHSSTTKKNSISINETLDLLCGTGFDNLTRLWSLNGGPPVRVIRPPDKLHNHRSWLGSDPWKATLHLFQKNYKYSCDI